MKNIATHIQISLPYPPPKSPKSSQNMITLHQRGETTVIVKQKEVMMSVLNLFFRKLLEQKSKL